ncbi:hypothetical protein [Flavobacterium sp. CHNK8]|uniref:hypothetical protein n=1 Tax=Flavobacterium sp. CHNK8 TaxID=2871165 RepID=UPI00351D56E8
MKNLVECILNNKEISKEFNASAEVKNIFEYRVFGATNVKKAEAEFLCEVEQ